MKSSSVMSSFTLASMLAMMCLSSNALAKSTKSKQPAPNPAQASVQGAPLTAETWEFRIREEDSIFSIVTLKKGIASGLAHNHLIAATRYQAQLKANPKELEKGTFTFSTKVSDLEVDRADLQKRWFPTIKSLSWLTEPFSELKDSDRETIREHMLASDQLNAKNFPEISAKIVDIAASESQVGGKKYAQKANVAVTILGKTVARPFSANIALNGEELSVEAAGGFSFSDFGITPYSTMFGALGNQDKFHMLVSMRAVKK
jgi:hypothetical protein